MTHADLDPGMIWRLHHGDQEIARLNVTGSDMPWTHAEIEELAGFEEFRAVFMEQEQAADEEDWERLEDCFERIRSELTMTFPDGTPVAAFWLRIHGDGTAGWRWYDEPLDPVCS
nr:hypothetical protein OG461_13305 [Streptomyces sp. NBC_00995]